MPTASQWLQAFKIASIGFNAMRQLAAMSTSFFGREDRPYVLYDEDQTIKWIKISGAKRGINTESGDLYGWAFAKIINNGGNKELHIYADVGLGTEVAQAIGTGLLVETVDIVEVSSSNVTGKARFEYGSGDDTDIALVFRWNVPGLADNIDVESGDDVLTDYYDSFLDGIATLSRAYGSDLLAKAGTMRDQVTIGLFAGGIAQLIDSPNRLSGNVLTPIADTTGGKLAWTYTGIVKDLDDKMIEDSEVFKENTVAAGSVVAGSNNTGDFNFTKTPKQYCEDGDVVRLECLSTLGSTQKELFSVGSVNRGSEPYRITIGQNFDSRMLGILLRLERNMNLTGAGAAYLASPTITGETSDYVDMSSLKLYGTITKSNSGADLQIRLWRASTKGAADKVADSGTITDTEPYTIVCTEVNNSGITMTYTIDTGAAGDGDYVFEVELKIASVGDWWEIPLTNNMAGIWAIVLGRTFLYEFQTDPTETIPEGILRIWDESLNGYWA